MSRIISCLVAFLIVFGVVGSARAQEEDLGFIPDPESTFFGLQVSWLNVSEAVEKLITFNEDKELEIEAKYAEKEERILDRIVALEETNPELADKLEGRLESFQEKLNARLERMSGRLEDLEGRRDQFDEKKNEWVEQMQNRREELIQKKEEVQNRIEIRRATPSGELIQNRIEQRTEQGTEQGTEQNDAGDGQVAVPVRIQPIQQAPQRLTR